MLAPVLVVLACGGDGEPMCRSDDSCPPGHGCAGQACVPMLTGASAPFSLELVPNTDSEWAMSEHPDLVFSPGRVALEADRKLSISGAIERSDAEVDGAASLKVRLVASVPSRIPGKRDVQLETQGTARTPAGPIDFTLTMPARLLGRAAKIRVVPLPPNDRWLPPWDATVTLAAGMKLPMPRAADLLLVEGVLRDALSEAQRGYQARALMGEALASSVSPTDDQGRFKVRILASLPLDKVALELAPLDAALALPRLSVEPIERARLNLGTLRLPAHPRAESFQIPVVVQNMTTERVANATVRFRTQLDGAVGGEAHYVREAQTDARGSASIHLIPGSAGQPRDYTAAVVTPADSRSASRCFPAYAVASATGAGGRIGAALELRGKVELAGVVFAANGDPAADVRMTALRVEDDDRPCGLSALPASATTSGTGSYRLWLEPGEYRIEYEPPLGSASPLHAEEDVVVTAGGARDVRLPQGVLVEGLVQTAGGHPIEGCVIRAYAPGADQAELRGRGRTGSDGKFRIVLPAR